MANYFSRGMHGLLGTAAAAAIGLASLTAEASPVLGHFSGVLTSGNDDTGVFGVPGAGLSGLSLTGSFAYDPTLFVVEPGATTTESAFNGTAGAITVTLNIGSGSHTFANISVANLHLVSNGIDELDANGSTSTASPDGSSVNETVSFSVIDPAGGFLHGVGLNQNFNVVPPESDGSFSIIDLMGDGLVSASGAFTMSQIDAIMMIEPGSLGVLGAATLVVLTLRRRRT